MAWHIIYTYVNVCLSVRTSQFEKLLELGKPVWIEVNCIPDADKADILLLLFLCSFLLCPERASSTTGWMKLTTGPSKTSRLTRFINGCHALIISKYRHTVNYIYFILFLTMLPIILSLLMFVMKFFDEVTKMDPYNLRLYPEPIVVTHWMQPRISKREYGIRNTVYAYNEVASTAGATVKRSSIDMENYLIKNVKLEKSLSYVSACTFHQTTITAWFNRHLYHGSTLSLSLVYKALGKALADMDIDVVNLPRADSDPDTFITDTVSGSTKPATLITLYLCLIMACFTTYIIQEKVNQMRLLYLMADFHSATYWLLNLLLDYILYLVCMISILISLYMISLSSQYPRTGETMFRVTVLLIAFGFSALTFVYLLSFAFNDSNSGLSCIIFINFSIGNHKLLFNCNLQNIITILPHSHYCILCSPRTRSEIYCSFHTSVSTILCNLLCLRFCIEGNQSRWIL